jgi:hypothetical protein
VGLSSVDEAAVVVLEPAPSAVWMVSVASEVVGFARVPSVATAPAIVVPVVVASVVVAELVVVVAAGAIEGAFAGLGIAELRSGGVLEPADTVATSCGICAPGRESAAYSCAVSVNS